MSPVPPNLPVRLVTNKAEHVPYANEIIPEDVELVTSVSEASTDQQVPTAKALYDSAAEAALTRGVIGMVICTALDVGQGGGATVVHASGMLEGIAGNDFAVTATSILALFPGADQPDVNYAAFAADKNGTVKAPVIGGGNITVGQVKIDGLTIADGDQVTLIILR